SLAYSMMAHWRHEPTEPMAGCQQKYGGVCCQERNSSSRLFSGFTSKTLPSTVILAILCLLQLSNVAPCVRKAPGPSLFRACSPGSVRLVPAAVVHVFDELVHEI